MDKLINKKEFVSGRLIYDDKNNKLFSFSGQHINYLRPDGFSSNSIIVKKGITSGLRKGAVGYENIQNIQSDDYLIGTLNGYIITDLSVQEEKKYKIAINSIKNNQLNSESKYLKLNEEVVLSSNWNNIEFAYSVPYLSKDVHVGYQYKLEGYMNDWSNWTSDSSILFENVSFGDYVFKVRGAVGAKNITNVVEYSFSIERPWYFSNLAILGYILLVLLFSFLWIEFTKGIIKNKEKIC